MNTVFRVSRFNLGFRTSSAISVTFVNIAEKANLPKYPWDLILSYIDDFCGIARSYKDALQMRIAVWETGNLEFWGF